MAADSSFTWSAASNALSCPLRAFARLLPRVKTNTPPPRFTSLAHKLSEAIAKSSLALCWQTSHHASPPRDVEPRSSSSSSSSSSSIVRIHAVAASCVLRRRARAPVVTRAVCGGMRA